MTKKGFYGCTGYLVFYLGRGVLVILIRLGRFSAGLLILLEHFSNLAYTTLLIIKDFQRLYSRKMKVCRQFPIQSQIGKFIFLKFKFKWLIFSLQNCQLYSHHWVKSRVKQITLKENEGINWQATDLFCMFIVNL